MNMNDIFNFIQTYYWFFILPVGPFFVLWGIKTQWRNITLKIQLWWIGRPFRATRLPTLLIPDQTGWFQIERSVCGAYYRLYSSMLVDTELYDKSASYLRKAHELGRKPLPLWGWLVVGSLVLAESIFFGMIIAELGLDGITPNNQPFYAAQIGGVLAVLLMLATHVAGNEWHHNDLVEKVGKLSKEGVRNGSAKTASALTTNTKISIDNDPLDDNRPLNEQLLNRLNTNYDLSPDRRWIYGTLISLLLIMALSFIARLSVADLSEFMGGAEDFLGFNSLAMDSFSDLIPEDSLQEDGPNYLAISGKLSVLIIFSLLFFGIQAISIQMGRDYGFSGIESADAFKNIRAYKTKQEFLNHHKVRQLAIANAAQAQLNALQDQIMAHISQNGLDPDAFHYAKTANERTFPAYIHHQSTQENTHENFFLTHGNDHNSDRIVKFSERQE